MTLKASKAISLIGAAVSLLLAGAAPLQAAGEDMYDYTKIPPFIEVGLNPNLLMLIDNSASMYDPAYGAPAGSSCYAADYDTAKPYAGYFEPTDDSWYVYDLTDHRFESASASDADSACANATGDHYTAADLCLSVDATPDPDVVTAFAAKGRFLNWLAASKFDVEKEILTGGKYNSTRKEMVLEARGCLEERFVKQTPVSKGGTNYFAVFGIRPPSNTEKIADMAYYGDPAIFATTNNTRIEIFKPSLTGFNASACDNAIAYWATPGADLGTLKTKTTACLGGSTTLLIASHTALNHILQECWYYKSFGDFQNGAGTVTSLRLDCQDVYDTTPGFLPDADYVPPGSLRVSDVCSGTYGPYAYDDWGYGYVGKCWEPAVAMVAEVCTSANPPLLAKNAVQDALGNYYYCDLAIDGDGNPATGWYRQCAKEPNRTNGNCPGGWATRKVETGVPGEVDWTDDNGDNAYACIDNALRSYCQNLDDVTVVDPDVNDPLGTAWSLPAVLIGTATEAQLGAPLKALEGRVYKTSAPNGLIHEFKYNLRLGAMKFNPGPVSECEPILRLDGTWKASLYDCLLDKGSDIDNSTLIGRHVSLPDPAKSDGGKVVREIDDGDVHVAKLVTAINSIVANAWTPLAEAYSEAVGYYTQRKSSRLNGGTGAPGTANDYICDQDAGLYSDWVANHTYNAGDRVKATWDYDDDGANETKLYFTDAGGTSTAGAANIGKDLGVRWTPFDPVLAGCQSNNILIITDGTSTADLNPEMTADVIAGYNDGDPAKIYHSTATNSDVQELANYECKNPTDLHTLYGSSLLDDLSYYANARTAAALFVDDSVGALAKKKIITYVVATGSLGAATTYECNPKFQLQQVAANSGTELLESSDMAMLEVNLRKIFKTIGGEPASGSAASVISNSRSGEGAIFQAVFYPNQEDAAGREITWAGDVHALWLDERGNIREDCGSGGCAVGNEDFILDKKVDRILQFYTDDISGAARARSFTDADGDGNIDDLNGDGDIDADDKFADNINLRDIPYLWSAGEWLSEVTEANVDTHRPYGDIVKQRHILTSINGTTMIPFTAANVRAALGSDSAYYGYVGFGAANPDNTSAAAKVDEANDIISYVRGDDTKFKFDGVTPRGYRSRLIDWYGDGTPEIWKLGDIVSSTPTVVSTPAEDYDLVYGDTSYQAFRQRYRNRRAMIYAGGNDGGLHAFNGGYYNRATNKIDKAPPVDTDGTPKKEYDLGGEMWMFVPKNAIPHLKWLTDPNYSHVNYVDLKPYIFDAKIFTPDTDHPQGWGTLLVGGMGFGGGDIWVDTDADGDDDEIMRASYFVLDITNPEVAPTILREFTHQNLGYPIGSPTAIPMLLCTLKIDCPNTTWPMDWFLALPSGPHDATLPMAALNAKSDQLARIFTLPLGGTGTNLGPVGSTFSPDLETFTTSDAAFTNSFFTDVIAVDYDLDFKTDTLYFGSVAHAVSDTTGTHTGGIHRLVTHEQSDRKSLVTPWELNTFFKTPGFQPVSGSPSVAYDGQRAWVYFGTGRYYSAQLDKKNLVQQSYYGVKENYNLSGDMDLISARANVNLVDVSKIWVEEGSGALHSTAGVLDLKAHDYVAAVADTTLTSTTFKALNVEMSEQVITNVDKFHGWKLDFDPLNGERNLGQAAILGNIVTFTTFVPSEDLCKPEGESFLWATYYRTGTAYYKSVIGLDIDNPTEVVRKVSVGAGLASTPNIHSGAEAGATAFVQTSTGAIVSVQQDTPGVVKSGMQSWRELKN